jgi:DNA polymerase-1
MTGIADRKTIKTLNFGAAYSMGINTMAREYGWDLQEASEVYHNYHKKVPFVRETSNRVAMKAKRIGFIKTLLGRRAYMPSSNKAYVMFNRLIQGSAADVMKKAMVDAYEEGLFNVLIPHITVHDELDVSMPNTKAGKEAGKELKFIMENCVELKVPIKADFEIGNNWGELNDWDSLFGI